MKKSIQRFLLVGLIWLVIVGGLWWYVTHRDARLAQRGGAQPLELSVARTFSLKITSTFATEQDPFALSTDPESSGETVLIKLNGRSLQLPAGQLLRGRPLSIADLQGVLSGHNELYVKARPPLSENMLEHGLRLELFEGATKIIDQTVWRDGGSLVSGSVSFSYQDQEDDQHDH